MKNLLFLTGAAARISQEVAILDKLIEYKDLHIDSKNTVLAGFSSGALNIGAINACFRAKDNLSWEKDFKENLLFKITTNNVYHKERFIPVNTGPLRITLEEFLKKASISTMSDFSFVSFILAFSYRRLTTVWASNFFNRHRCVDVLDLLMATSAIPLIFPDQVIRKQEKKHKRFLRGSFADGGTAGSFKRFEFYLKKYLRQNDSFDNLYIISPKRQISDDDFDELKHLLPATRSIAVNLKQLRVLRLFLDMISQNGFDTFVKRFYKWCETNTIAENIYICKPAMDADFPFLNFDRQKEQYDSVCAWVDNNPDNLAVPISEYVKKFEHSPLSKITTHVRRKIKHRIRGIIG
jgi:hypothetical protein